MIATVPLKVVVAISLALSLISSPIPIQTTEVDKPIGVTGLSSITTAVDTVKPAQPTFN
jgi:hypothetical protein